jgi:hypothetical protein
VLLVCPFHGHGRYWCLRGPDLIIKGADTVVVPDLVGKDVLYGLEILSDLGLNTRVKGTAYHDQVPKNHVIDQDPDAGAAIKRGRDVKIRVSRGPETILCPIWPAFPCQQSRILLTENGLCQGVLSGMISPRFDAGQIMAQYPPAGGNRFPQYLCRPADQPGTFASPAFPMVDLSGFCAGASAIRRLEQMQLTVGSIRIVRRIGAPRWKPSWIRCRRPVTGGSGQPRGPHGKPIKCRPVCRAMRKTRIRWNCSDSPWKTAF